jgi:hypothetical protein
MWAPTKAFSQASAIGVPSDWGPLDLYRISFRPTQTAEWRRAQTKLSFLNSIPNGTFTRSLERNLALWQLAYVALICEYEKQSVVLVMKPCYIFVMFHMLNYYQDIIWYS